MNTTRVNYPQKSLRIFAISAAASFALAMGAPATAAAANAIPQTTKSTKSTKALSTEIRHDEDQGRFRSGGQDPWAFLLPEGHHHGGGDGDCRGLVVLLCA
ncbi:hypothetical protein [Streptomyces noursei]|uniref:Uncharacterized protein n=1 Tax=Streptomyces noursei TaxID=1971 RepID=A0A401QR72_STRNR|nr:hypothetical protein [Streptomyces noursei]UWS76401.1 hypothetical protein N1H47_37255 [Streptomyces noursei]GCB87896.1 hypothetical protein SALB_00565 [Streptomyces noursei]